MRRAYSSLLCLVSAALLVGCVKQEDFDVFKSQSQPAIDIAARYSSYFVNPPVFEIHNQTINSDYKVTAIIRTTDERLRGKSVLLDVQMTLLSGDVEVKSYPIFLGVDDGVGQIDEMFFLSPSEELKMVPSRPVSVRWDVRGWTELFPAVIERR